MAQTLAGPLAPGSLPLVGHALRLARRPEAFLTSLPAQGDLVRVRLGMIDTYVVCAPEVMHRVLSDTEVFEKGGPIYDKAREGAGNGIITCHNTEHPQQRKVVWPAFRRALLPGQAAIMTEQIDRSTASWHDGQTLDLIPHTSEISAAVSAKVFFPSLPDHEITELTHAFDTFLVGLFRRMTWPSALQEKLPTPGNRRYRDARDHLRRTVSRLVHDPHAADEQTGLLATILAARDTLDPPPTDEEIQGQIFNLLIAGIDTTASTLAWALYLVATHPDIQQRLHTEIDTVLDGRPPRFDDLAHLPLTERILTETLRLYPSAWMFTRSTVTPTELAGIPLAPGTHLVCSPYLIHRRPDLYPDPDRFDPDRWLTHPTTDLPKGAYIPFGAGVRTCIGRFFGITEATLALLTITSRWHLTPATTTPVRPRPRATMSAHTMPIRLHNRQTAT